MLVNCKKCGKKFGLNEEPNLLIGKKIQCRHCFNTWNYMPILKDLNGKLQIIDNQLIKVEKKIKENNANNEDKINKLLTDLDLKKKDLIKQDKALEKIQDLQNRLNVTDGETTKNEKLNNQINNLEREIKNIDNKLEKKNQDIQMETNLIETKVVNYSDTKANINDLNSNLNEDNDNNFEDNIDSFEKEKTKTKTPDTGELALDTEELVPDTEELVPDTEELTTDTGELVRSYFRKKKENSLNKKNKHSFWPHIKMEKK